LKAIVNAKTFTISDGILERATVLMKDGKITRVGPDLPLPPDTQIVDGSGCCLLPGFIDAHTHIALFEDGNGPAGNDGNESTDPNTAHVRAIDGIYPGDIALSEALAGGVTAGCIAPGSANVLGGQVATVKFRGTTVDDMLMEQPAGLKAAFGENPKRAYGSRDKMPSTRMGVAAVMREAFTRAGDYARKKRAAVEDETKTPDTDLRLESLLLVLERAIPLRVHAHRADDIMTALRIAEEFNLDITIEHCTEGHKVAQVLAERRIPCVVGPSMVSRMKVELRDRSGATAGLLARAGVKVAITVDHPVLPLSFLPVAAASCCREGMSEVDALKAITLNAADICGVGDRLGSIEEGKDADLVLWSGHPFDYRSKVVRTFIDGETVYVAGERED